MLQIMMLSRFNGHRSKWISSRVAPARLAALARREIYATSFFEMREINTFSQAYKFAWRFSPKAKAKRKRIENFAFAPRKWHSWCSLRFRFLSPIFAKNSLSPRPRFRQIFASGKSSPKFRFRQGLAFARSLLSPKFRQILAFAKSSLSPIFGRILLFCLSKRYK